MRRAIDSHYMRKKRHSRRARDNWRRVKNTHEVKKMYTDKQLWITGITLLTMWLTAIAWMMWDAFK